MIVVDASALFELLMNSTAGLDVNKRLLAPTGTLHAPHLVDLEVTQAIRRHARTGRVDERSAATALGDLDRLRLYRYPHAELLPRIWELRHNLTAYDASYVALAEMLRAPLVTCDAGLAGASGHDAQIELFVRR